MALDFLASDPFVEQGELLHDFGEALYKKFLTQKNVYLLMAANKEEAFVALQALDALYHTAQTSLLFGQPHRALRYYLAFRAECLRTFSPQKISDAYAALQNLK